MNLDLLAQGEAVRPLRRLPRPTACLPAPDPSDAMSALSAVKQGCTSIFPSHVSWRTNPEFSAASSELGIAKQKAIVLQKRGRRDPTFLPRRIPCLRSAIGLTSPFPTISS